VVEKENIQNVEQVRVPRNQEKTEAKHPRNIQGKHQNVEPFSLVFSIFNYWYKPLR
jgi:hypothetical protein